MSLKSLNDAIERVVMALLSALFAGLIFVVFLQVFSRNVLKVSMIWTPDVAQLLFSWCIFLGAAIAFRRGEHYEVNIFSKDAGRILKGFVELVGVITAAAVIYVLAGEGLTLARLTLSQEVVSLGISRTWFVAPIGIGGALMGLFLIERVVRDLRR
ncbi:MAG: TRAP transporter small permease [Pseudomonadota bacterium]